MQKRLLEILACPIDKHYPLELLEFELREEVIVSGVLLCDKCGRYYPITDEIPVMLPDALRNKKEDLAFLEKWKDRLPDKVVRGGKPWAPCGTFVVEGTQHGTVVRLNAPYEFQQGDTWKVFKQLPGKEEPGPAVLVPTANA